MKTLTRYVVAIAAAVTFLVAIKVLILVPPESGDKQNERHNKEKSVLWGQVDDGHDELHNYGRTNLKMTGEMGRGVVLPPGEKTQGEEALKKYNVNVLASDLISLNRRIPDSRPVGCESIQYPDDLPGTAVVIPFHNEWPSVLLRTVYSIINRTPKHILQQIILVDDASDLQSLKEELDHFIREHFPSNLVKLLRMPERVGLIRARLEGFRYVTAEVVSFMDSHMEVNLDWLQPLLVEIKKNPKTVAMGHLDYILPDTFEYSFTPGYRTRYGFDWRLIFFETEFLKSQEKGKDITDPMPGVVMVGPGFAIRSDYFKEMGMYDEGMKIWGGENLELPWRIWMCGGRLVHLACSKLGHIARPQPYSFPEGRYETEMHNYKRAIEVWMGPYKQLVYDHHPKMKEIDVGDLTERRALRKRLECKSFTWFLKNVWPELYPYGDNATHWGSVRNQKEAICLDNNQFLFLGPDKLSAKPCKYQKEDQSFALTLDHKLRSVLQCVGVQEEGADMLPVLITCHDEPFHTWTYTAGNPFNGSTWTYTSTLQLKHDQTGLCLELMVGPRLVMQSCRRGYEGQVWRFESTGHPHSLASETDDGLEVNNKEKEKQPEKKNEPTKSPKEMLEHFGKLMQGGMVDGGPMQAGAMQGGHMQGGPMPGGPMQGGPMPGGPMLGGPMPGGSMPGGPMQGGPMPGGPMQGGPMPGGPMQGGPMPGGPMPGGAMQGMPMQGAPMQGPGGHMMQGGGGMPMQDRQMPVDPRLQGYMGKDSLRMQGGGGAGMGGGGPKMHQAAGGRGGGKVQVMQMPGSPNMARAGPPPGMGMQQGGGIQSMARGGPPPPGQMPNMGHGPVGGAGKGVGDAGSMQDFMKFKEAKRAGHIR